jgi:hypothetical protein
MRECIRLLLCHYPWRVTLAVKRPFDEFSATTTSLPHPGGNCGEFDAGSVGYSEGERGGASKDVGLGFGKHYLSKNSALEKKSI